MSPPAKPVVYSGLIMTIKNVLIDSVIEKLNREIRLPHHASSIAYDLFVLNFRFKLGNDPLMRELLSKFFFLLSERDLEDLLIRQVCYAQKIAQYNYDIEYEEMHKLISLCDEIYALEYLGLCFDKYQKNQFKRVVQARFKRERVRAKLVAEDKVEDWKKNFWWYKNNIEN